MRFNNWLIFRQFVVLFIIILVINSCEFSPKKTVVKVDGKYIRIEFDNQLHSRIVTKIHGKGKINLTKYSSSEFLVSNNDTISDFLFQKITHEKIQGEIGSGIKYRITGLNKNLEKTVVITLYDKFPTMAVYNVKYKNKSKKIVKIDQWINNQYKVLSRTEFGKPPFWSYQSASYISRPDWVLPINHGFSQENYLGMNASDYGGGTPVLDLWRKDVGIAIGHLETVPKLISLPVKMSDSSAVTICVKYNSKVTLKPGESLKTFQTFVSVHQGDYFSSLKKYRNIMLYKGIKFRAFPETAYEPIWCAWGYGRDFTIDQIKQSLQQVKELGYQWVVLDDGWQVAEGDWVPNKKHFPNGNKSMKEFVDTIHKYGLKAKLWWAPMAVDEGTNLFKEHPEYLLLNKDSSKQHISWWDAYYLCPADQGVLTYTKELVKKFIGDWGYDGLKVDGQHLNAAPPCYNHLHHHKHPEESSEKMPNFFRTIYNTALEIKDNAVIEICPCGTGYSFFTMPYMNQPVASDPTSSLQIRLKGKTFKALMGTSVPFYGDHVELSDGRDDFASTVGIGGVIGTKFTVKPNSKKDSTFYLTKKKKQEWAKWMKIYKENMLPKGTYLGKLYDIGYDKPETHVVYKDGIMYYSFYSDEWDGEVEFRGLENKKYNVYNYVEDKVIGTVSVHNPNLNISFKDYLLVACIPNTN